MVNSDIGEKESLIKVTSVHPIKSWIHDRGKWGCQTEYYLAVLSACFTVQAFYMLPFLLWYGGGISILLPFFLITVLVGIPMYYLQASLGQASGAGLISIFNVCPILKGLGYASWFYNLIQAGTSVTTFLYASYYLWISITSAKPPWESCSNIWNTDRCGNPKELQSSSIAEFFRGLLSTYEQSEHPQVITPLVVIILLVWMLVGLTNSRGIRWIGKLSYVTVLLPILLLTMLTIRGVTLPGAFDGLYTIFSPNWGVIFAPQTWIVAGTLQFYFFGGGGILLTLSSYNNFQNNLKKDMIIIFILTVFFTILSALFTGAFLGYLAHCEGISTFDLFVGTDFMFVDFVFAASTISNHRFWLILFFLTIALFEFGSLALITNTLEISLLDELPSLRNYKTRLNYGLCLVLAILSLPYSVYGLLQPQFTFSFLNHAILMAILLVQLLLIGWVLGKQKISEEFFNMYHKEVSNVWFWIWKVIDPILLFLILMGTNTNLIGYLMQELPNWVSSVTWILDFAPFIFVIFYAVYYAYCTEGSSFIMQLKNSWKPISLGPKDAEEFEEHVEFTLTDDWNGE